jgi:hypothetical protein
MAPLVMTMRLIAAIGSLEKRLRWTERLTWALVGLTVVLIGLTAILAIQASDDSSDSARTARTAVPSSDQLLWSGEVGSTNEVSDVALVRQVEQAANASGARVLDVSVLAVHGATRAPVVTI